MSESSSSVSPSSTSATSTAGGPGLLWVTTSVMKKDNLSPALLDAWYDEHMADVLACPGNGGLFLRYQNLSPAAHPHADPKFADRFLPSASVKNIVDAQWPNLALVKLADINWLTSQQFNDMPRVSKLLPLEPDGSIGSAFSCWHAALRSYETIGKIADEAVSAPRAKYILSVQTEDASEATWEALDKTYATMPGFRSSVRYRNVDGLLGYQEPGALPVGLALYEFDGEEPPSIFMDESHVKADVWKLTKAAGDASLGL